MTVKKVLEDPLLSNTRLFRFSYQYIPEGASEAVTGTFDLTPVSNDTNGANFELTVPINASVTVTEITTGSYADVGDTYLTKVRLDDEEEVIDTSMTIDRVTEDHRITFTNTRQTQPVSVWKTDLDHNPLTGAMFALYRADDYNDVAGAPNAGAAPVVSVSAVDEQGILSLGDLSVGEYRLIETQAPAGYVALESAIRIFVRSNAVTAMQGTGNAEVARNVIDSEYKQYWVDGQPEGTWQVRVWNNPGVALPSTGGPGTSLIYLLGIMLTGIAGAGLVMRKRRRI